MLGRRCFAHRHSRFITSTIEPEIPAMIKIIEVLIQLVSALFGVLGEFFLLFWDLTTQGREPGYKASFETTFLSTEVSSRYEGFTLNGHLQVKPEHSVHQLCTGMSGSGKSQLISYIHLAKLENASAIVYDPFGELRQELGQYKNLSHEVIEVSFSDAQLSIGYNPFAGKLDRPDKRAALAAKLASAESTSATGRKDFWGFSSERVIDCLLILLSHFPIEQQNPASLKKLADHASFNPDGISKLMAKYVDDATYEAWLGIISQDQKVLMNQLSTVQAALQLFANPEVRQCTSVARVFDFQKLRKKPTIIFITGNVSGEESIGRLVSLFVDQFIQDFLEVPATANDLNVYAVLDEFGSLPSVESMMRGFVLLRKRKVRLCIMVQNFENISARYGQHGLQTILSNTSTKVFIGPQQGDMAAKYIEGFLGMNDYETDKGRRTLPLLSMQDIKKLPKDDVLAFVGSHVYRLKARPYYRNKALRKQVQSHGRPVSHAKASDYTIQTITIPKKVSTQSDHEQKKTP